MHIADVDAVFIVQLFAHALFVLLVPPSSSSESPARAERCALHERPALLCACTGDVGAPTGKTSLAVELKLGLPITRSKATVQDC